MFAEHENDEFERHLSNAGACNKLLALLRQHHPECSPPNITKPACKAVATPEPAKVESVPEPAPAPTPPPKPPIPTHPVTSLLRSASLQFGLSMDELLSPRHQPHLARARHIVMLLATEQHSLSYPDIGRRLAGRDHTTVLSGVRKMRRLLSEGDVQLASDIEAVRARAFPSPVEEPIWS